MQSSIKLDFEIELVMKSSYEGNLLSLFLFLDLPDDYLCNRFLNLGLAISLMIVAAFYSSNKSYFIFIILLILMFISVVISIIIIVNASHDSKIILYFNITFFYIFLIKLILTKKKIHSFIQVKRKWNSFLIVIPNRIFWIFLYNKYLYIK